MGTLGLTSVCKQCRNDAAKQKVFQPVNAGKRTCSACGAVRPATIKFFHRNKRDCSGLVTRCRSCACAAAKRWAAEHPVKVKAISKAWYQHNRARAAARNRQYADEHPDLIRQIKRRYDLKNPMKRRGITHRYRSAKRAIPGRWTSKDVVAKLLAQQHLCYYCGAEVTRPHIDHKIPLARKDLGPTNYPSNIVVACARCNQSKGKRTDDEYIAYRRDRGLPINQERTA